MTNSVKFYEHPQYFERKDHWQAQRDLFIGEHKTLTDPKYLWPHEFETQNKASGGSNLRNIRVQRTQYINFLRPFVERFVAILFSKRPNIDVAKTAFGDLIDNVDGRGTDLITFIAEHIAKPYFLHGNVYILTDSFGVTARNRAEETALGLRPFWEPMPVLSVPDWEIEAGAGDRNGKMNMLRCEYELLEGRENLDEEPKIECYSKVLRLVDGVYVVDRYKAEGKKDSKQLIERVQKDAGQYAYIDTVTPTKPTGETFDELPVAWVERESWAQKIVPIALLRHNTQSTLDNVILFQAYQRIIASGVADAEDGLVMHEGTVTLVPEGANIEVVEPCNTQYLESRLAHVTDAMFRVAFNQTRSLGGDSKQVASMETIREMKEEFIKSAIKALDDIEHVANKAIQDFAAFLGRDIGDDGIEFDRELTIDDVEQQLALLQVAEPRVKRHTTWDRAVSKKLASAMQFNEDDLQEILEEIEETEPPQTEPVQARNNRLRNIINGREQRSQEADQAGESDTGAQ